MNLTKLFVAGLCFTAMTASAVVIKEDSFESGTFTNAGWSGFDSTFGVNIIGGTNGVTDANSPMVGVGDDGVLHLNTNGAVWTNAITGATFLTTPIYADMLVKFVPSEDLPTLDSGVKLAAAVTNGFLVVTKNGSQWNSTTQPIDTNFWYRFSVELKIVNTSNFIPDEQEPPGYWAISAVKKAVVKINGTNVVVGGETEFIISDILGSSTLTAIGFQGTGFIDEVVVRDDDPLAGAGATLTLQFATGVGSVYVGVTQKNTGDTVTSGDALIILAAQFYEIASVTGADTSWSLGGLNETGGVVTVTSATNATVTITAQAETDATPYAGSGSFTNYPASDVATWAIAKGVTALTEGIYDNYLLNISTNSLPQLLIKSVAVTNSIVTVTVEAAGVDFSDINGTLKLMVSPVLGGTSSNITAAVSGTTTATVSTDIGTNKFVKALIE
jgi:hypothetical protein